jgi:hypothetical protein
MAFGRPTRYLQLNLNRVSTSPNSNNIRTTWDNAVEQASDEYKKRMVFDRMFSFRFFIVPVYTFFQHNLCCDNCHSHVAMALNTMNYDRKHTYNMISLTFWMFFCGKFVRYININIFGFIVFLLF